MVKEPLDLTKPIRIYDDRSKNEDYIVDKILIEDENMLLGYSSDAALLLKKYCYDIARAYILIDKQSHRVVSDYFGSYYAENY